MSDETRIAVLEAEILRLRKIIEFRDQRIQQFQQSFNEIQQSVQNAARMQTHAVKFS